MLKRVIATLASTLLTCSVAAAAPARPNIVIIMADDMGFSDVGCYGSEIRTPNIDRLASQGLRFTQFYNNARCCPTRASLLTGLYPHQAGVGHMVADHGLPAYRGFLNDRCVTIAEALKPAGYRTLMSGKWHVGESRPHWPVDRGFDHYFGLISGAMNYFRIENERRMALDNEPWFPPKDGFYMTDAITDHAVRFLDQYGKGPDPFFLYVPYTAPHWPLHALPEDIARYEGKYAEGWEALRARRYQRMIDLGIIKPSWKLAPPDEKEPAWNSLSDAQKKMFAHKMAVYAAQVDREDQNIGRLMNKLKDLGVEENTLVMFLADNGGCAEEIDRGTPGVAAGPADSFLSYGLPWAHASNTPFRLFKHWVHEGGISTPLIVHWPAVIRQGGKVTEQAGHLMDLMATCIDVSGATYPKEFKGRPVTPLEGRSLAPIFRDGKREGHDAIFWEHEGNRAVRQGKWKLVALHKKPWELYDVEADRTELHDLAGDQPERVAKMSAMWDVWAKRAGVVPFDDLPKAKPTAAAAQRARKRANQAR